MYNVGSGNSGRDPFNFQSYDDRDITFTNGTGIYINEAEIVVADIRARSSRGDEQVLHNSSRRQTLYICSKKIHTCMTLAYVFGNS